MSIVDLDAVVPKHCLNFFHYVGSHSLNAVLIFQGVGMVSLQTVHVEDVLVGRENLKVDALNNKTCPVILFIFRLN